MSRTLRIYHSEAGGAKLALTVKLDDQGAVRLTRGRDKEAAEVLLDLVGKGVVSMAEPPAVGMTMVEPTLVGPKEGAAYLDAVAAMLGHSSRWLVSDD